MYAATPDGINRLECWMYAATPPENSRDALLAKLAIARPQDVPRLLEMTRNQEAQLRRQLGGLQEMLDGCVERPGPGAAAARGCRARPLVEARRLAAALESLQEIREALEHELRGAPSPRR